MTEPVTIGREDVIADIAAALGVAPHEVPEDGDLTDAGLDSVRLMSLVEKWRAAGAPEADFATLAAEPVLGVWLDVLVPGRADRT
ncbi:phosphopantetheine-binding protein [Nocardia brasiliensis]|uniref:phosphopantetheine-binding protein n=1 Tax=Nocardia brasiliensis TaxID=37326 RepID=UPI0018945464|nr:phosphopantetheine-binding protein [Nocardia brasiliensis]MBF6543503.1 isochorismatase [Nocardia brasiliensis]